MPLRFSRRALQVVLVVVGLVIVLLGLNVGLGGIQTLGWQGQVKFFEVTDEHGYLVQNSHIRFLGGLFGGVGAFLILAATDLRRYQLGLKLVFALIFLGGLARFSQLRLDVVFGPDILGSLLAELVLMPVLFIWLSRETRVG